MKRQIFDGFHQGLEANKEEKERADIPETSTGQKLFPWALPRATCPQ
jgi:hypothetical protein